MRDTAPDTVPLVDARRRYGRRALGLAVLAVALIALVVIAQSPPALRRSGLTLAAILVLMCVGVGGLSLVWTWMIAWPTERRRLRNAELIRPVAGRSLESGDPRGPLTTLVVGGLLVGALLWGSLNAVGLVGAPMLWIVVGTINLEVARRVERVERVEHAVYYEAASLPFKGGRRLFVLRPASAGYQSPASDTPRLAAREQSKAPSHRQRMTTGGMRR
ncbi:MAG: hypothetical protein LC769_06615 [Chloroflexi bacterium]|nr:hypothetical protein [Chloroflexota bacterium]